MNNIKKDLHIAYDEYCRNLRKALKEKPFGNMTEEQIQNELPSYEKFCEMMKKDISPMDEMLLKVYRYFDQLEYEMNFTIIWYEVYIKNKIHEILGWRKKKKGMKTEICFDEHDRCYFKWVE